jgi:hypothetical protein
MRKACLTFHNPNIFDQLNSEDWKQLLVDNNLKIEHILVDGHCHLIVQVLKLGSHLEIKDYLNGLVILFYQKTLNYKWILREILLVSLELLPC